MPGLLRFGDIYEDLRQCLKLKCCVDWPFDTAQRR